MSVCFFTSFLAVVKIKRKGPYKHSLWNEATNMTLRCFFVLFFYSEQHMFFHQNKEYKFITLLMKNIYYKNHRSDRGVLGSLHIALYLILLGRVSHIKSDTRCIVCVK